MESKDPPSSESGHPQRSSTEGAEGPFTLETPSPLQVEVEPLPSPPEAFAPAGHASSPGATAPPSTLPIDESGSEPVWGEQLAVIAGPSIKMGSSSSGSGSDRKSSSVVEGASPIQRSGVSSSAKRSLASTVATHSTDAASGAGTVAASVPPVASTAMPSNPSTIASAASATSKGGATHAAVSSATVSGSRVSSMSGSTNASGTGSLKSSRWGSGAGGAFGMGAAVLVQRSESGRPQHPLRHRQSHPRKDHLMKATEEGAAAEGGEPAEVPFTEVAPSYCNSLLRKESCYASSKPEAQSTPLPVPAASALGDGLATRSRAAATGFVPECTTPPAAAKPRRTSVTTTPAQPIIDALRKRASVVVAGVAAAAAFERRRSCRMGLGEVEAPFEYSASQNNSCTAKHRTFSDSLVSELYRFLLAVGKEVEAAALRKAMAEDLQHCLSSVEAQTGSTGGKDAVSELDTGSDSVASGADGSENSGSSEENSELDTSSLNQNKSQPLSSEGNTQAESPAKGRSSRSDSPRQERDPLSPGQRSPRPLSGETGGRSGVGRDGPSPLSTAAVTVAHSPSAVDGGVQRRPAETPPSTSHEGRRRARKKPRRNLFPLHKEHNNLEFSDTWFSNPNKRHPSPKAEDTAALGSSSSSRCMPGARLRSMASLVEGDTGPGPADYFFEAVTAEPPLFFSGMVVDPASERFLLGGLAFLQEARVLKVPLSALHPNRAVAGTSNERSCRGLLGQSADPAATTPTTATATATTPTAAAAAATANGIPFSPKLLIREFISVSKKYEGHIIQTFSVLTPEAAATVMPSKHQAISAELTRKLVLQTLPGCMTRAFPLLSVARRTKQLSAGSAGFHNRRASVITSAGRSPTFAGVMASAEGKKADGAHATVTDAGGSPESNAAAPSFPTPSGGTLLSPSSAGESVRARSPPRGAGEAKDLTLHPAPSFLGRREPRVGLGGDDAGGRRRVSLVSVRPHSGSRNAVANAAEGAGSTKVVGGFRTDAGAGGNRRVIKSFCRAPSNRGGRFASSLTSAVDDNAGRGAVKGGKASSASRKPRREPIGHEIALSDYNPQLYEWALSKDPAELQDPIDNIQAFLAYFVSGFKIKHMIKELLGAARCIQRFLRRCLDRKHRAMDSMLRKWRSLEVEARLRLQHYHPPPSSLERIELIATSVLQQYILTTRDHKTKLINDLWQERRKAYYAYKEQTRLDEYVRWCKREGRQATVEGWQAALMQQRLAQRSSMGVSSDTQERSNTFYGRSEVLSPTIKDFPGGVGFGNRSGSTERRGTASPFQGLFFNDAAGKGGGKAIGSFRGAAVGRDRRCQVSMHSLSSAESADLGPAVGGARPPHFSYKSLSSGADNGAAGKCFNEPSGTAVFSAAISTQQARENSDVHTRFGWFIPPEKLLYESHQRLLTSLRASILTVEQVQHEVRRAAAEAVEAQQRAAAAAATARIRAAEHLAKGEGRRGRSNRGKRMTESTSISLQGRSGGYNSSAAMSNRESAARDHYGFDDGYESDRLSPSPSSSGLSVLQGADHQKPNGSEQGYQPSRQTSFTPINARTKAAPGVANTRNKQQTVPRLPDIVGPGGGKGQSRLAAPTAASTGTTTAGRRW